MKRSSFKRKPKKHGKPKEKTLKAKLDKIYSEYIRRSEADTRGHITCYCGAVVHFKQSDCSHFVPRGCLNLRYDPRNTKASCRKCNRFMGGNLHYYALYLEKTYGAGILQDLERDKRVLRHNFPYQEQIDHYKTLLSQLEV